jgi:hypothetical protein
VKPVIPVPPVIKEKIHTHATHVYHWGEHGCAVSYAMHEFIGGHIVVLTLSGILLVGLILVVLDLIVEVK